MKKYINANGKDIREGDPRFLKLGDNEYLDARQPFRGVLIAASNGSMDFEVGYRLVSVGHQRLWEFCGVKSSQRSLVRSTF